MMMSRLVGIGLCLLTFSSVWAQTKSSPPRQYRALLIGIDTYKESYVDPTPGCEADARETGKFIQEKFGFPASSIRYLIGPQATAQNIRQAIKDWLIKDTEPGAYIFFLYAGHGSQLPDDNGDEKDDRLDETLAPYDVNQQIPNSQIRDDEFESFLSQLSRRRVVMVFDSCHSGTISRDSRKRAGKGRYLPPFEEAGGRALPQGPTRDLHLFRDTTNATALDGIVILSAAQSDQVAYPIALADGRDRGALSWILAELHQGERRPTLAQLRTLIPAQIKNYQNRKTPAGDPMLEGKQVPMIEALSTTSLENLPLFGEAQSPGAASAPPTPGPPMPGAMPAVVNSQSGIRLSFRTLQNTTVFRIGEGVSYELTANTDGYFYLLVFSQDSVATCIYPNFKENSNKLRAGETRLITDQGQLFPIQEPVGKDVVVALFSTQPLPLGEKVNLTWEEAFRKVNLSALQAAVKSIQGVPWKADLQGALQSAETRGIGVNNNLSPRNWQAAVLVLETIQ